jgi:hypothetical protein
VGEVPPSGDGEATPAGDGDDGGGDVDVQDADPDLNGCTPGYWKQEQHVDAWPAPWTPDSSFVDAFGVDAFPGLTLLDVLGLGDGDLDALGRHAVAAFLNALTPDVAYPLTDVEVVAAFGEAYDLGVYEETKDLLNAYNEDHCPLN